MKKLGLVLIMLLALSACGNDEATCTDNQLLLEDGTCVEKTEVDCTLTDLETVLQEYCDAQDECADDEFVFNGECVTEYPVLEDTFEYENAPYAMYLNDTNPVVTIKVKNIGDITLQLFPEVAPNTVNNFIGYIEDEAYTDNAFHRVVDGFMIQGGSLTDPTCQIKGEMTNNGITNDLSHTPGVVSMARIGGLYDSQTSQFFIMDGNATFLDGEYASFGAVVGGMNIVEFISSVQSPGTEMPAFDIEIEEITVDLKGQTYDDRVCLADYEYPTPDVNLPEETFINTDLLSYKEYLSENNPVVTMVIEGVGTMKFELFKDVAPNTVNNFINLIEDGVYDGNQFHRIVEDFVIQAGILEEETCRIDGEFTENGFENNVLHDRGVLSMAYKGETYDLQASQFFVMVDEITALDGEYAAFGGLISGFNVLDYISSTQSSTSETSIYSITITDISVELNGYVVSDTICVE